MVLLLDDSTGSDDLDSSETRLLLPRSPHRQPLLPPGGPPLETEMIQLDRLRLRIKTVTDAKEHPLDVDLHASVAEVSE